MQHTAKQSRLLQHSLGNEMVLFYNAPKLTCVADGLATMAVATKLSRTMVTGS